MAFREPKLVNLEPLRSIGFKEVANIGRFGSNPPLSTLITHVDA